MRLRFTPTALRELDEILTYIAGRTPSGAERVQARLQRVFDVIAQNPKIGRPTSNLRLRRFAATPYPYLVFYKASAEEVIVVGVRHTRRDPSSRPDR